MKAGHIGRGDRSRCAPRRARRCSRFREERRRNTARWGNTTGAWRSSRPDERTLPRQITAIAVHTLPSADRAALSGGIAVYSREELYARLEDFGS